MRKSKRSTIHYTGGLVIAGVERQTQDLLPGDVIYNNLGEPLIVLACHTSTREHLAGHSAGKFYVQKYLVTELAVVHPGSKDTAEQREWLSGTPQHCRPRPVLTAGQIKRRCYE